MSSKPSILPGLAATFVAVQVGSAIVATRFVIGQTNPGSLALLRYSIAFLFVLPPTMATVRTPLQTRDLLPVSLLGITQFGIVITLLNYALQFIPSSRTALLFTTLPLQTMMIAALFGEERLTRHKTIGVVLAIIGVALVLGVRVTLGSTLQAWKGDIAVLASAGAAASCSVLYRPFLRKYPILQVSSLGMLAAVLFLAIFAAGEGFFTGLPSFTSGGWIAVLFIGIGSGIGFNIWLWALDNASPTRVTIFLSLSPIVATGIGAFLLDEQVTVTALIGMACVISGLVVAHIERSPGSGEN